MDINRINPELQKLYRWLPHLRMDWPWMFRLMRFMTKFQKSTADSTGLTVEEHTVGSASVRLFKPESRSGDGALLWIHGGGMIIGTSAMNDRECIHYAQQLGILVGSIEYRLAPEHPFPGALDDCYAVWQWLQDNAAELGVNPERVVISGQSAGGGLSASLALRIRDTGGKQPAGQALFCPMLDDRTAARTELDALKHKLWNNRSNRAAWGYYLGHPAGEPEERPHAVPARTEDLSGLPEAWIGIGDADLFLEECERYRDGLLAAGVACEFHPAPGGFHGFEGIATEAAVTRDLYASNYAFLRRVLALPS